MVLKVNIVKQTVSIDYALVVGKAAIAAFYMKLEHGEKS